MSLRTNGLSRNPANFPIKLSRIKLPTAIARRFLAKMKTLFLAWQAPNPVRTWFPIGRRDAAPEESYYRFRYTGGALSAERETGMKPLVAFPDFHRQYESPELFPLFKNRVLSPSRKDFVEYLGWLDLDANHGDPIAMLAVTGASGPRTILRCSRKWKKTRKVISRSVSSSTACDMSARPPGSAAIFSRMAKCSA